MWEIKVVEGVPFINCPECGTPLKAGIPICPKCNRPVQWDEENAIEVYYAKCPKCGADVEAFNDKCPECGAELVWDKEEHIKLKKRMEESGKTPPAKEQSEKAGGVQQPQVMKFKCPNCGTIVTGKPPKCPGCGAPFIWD